MRYLITLFIALVMGFTISTAQDLGSKTNQELEQMKEQAVKRQDFQLAESIKKELLNRKSIDEIIVIQQEELNSAIEANEFVRAGDLKKEIEWLKGLKSELTALEDKLDEAVKEERYADAQNIKQEIDQIKATARAGYEVKEIRSPNQTKAKAPVQENNGEDKTKTTEQQPGIDYNKFYYNSFGVSLRTGGWSYLYLEGRDIKWRLTDYWIAGAYLGVLMMPDNWVPSLALEANYIYDYGARFVPYGGAAAGMSLAIVTIESETSMHAGFVGFAKAGAFWFNKKKTSGLYTDLVVGYTGSVDFRVGAVFKFEKN